MATKTTKKTKKTPSKINLSKRNLKAGTKGAISGPLKRVTGNVKLR